MPSGGVRILRIRSIRRLVRIPGASFAMDGGGPVLAASVAEECNRIFGQDLTEVEERAHANLARKATERALEAREQLKVF